jgi:hypothetical protein
MQKYTIKLKEIVIYTKVVEAMCEMDACAKAVDYWQDDWNKEITTCKVENIISAIIKME